MMESYSPEASRPEQRRNGPNPHGPDGGCQETTAARPQTPGPEPETVDRQA
jgi:hypothetical protein